MWGCEIGAHGCTLVKERPALAVVPDGGLVQLVLVGVEHQVDEGVPDTDRGQHDDVKPEEAAVVLEGDFAFGGGQRGGRVWR